MHANDKERNRNYKIYINIFFVFLLSVMVISLAFNRSVWLDEGFSLRWSMWPKESFWERIKLDVCPLYLIMLRIIQTVTGESIYAAKLFSALPIIIIFIVAYKFVRSEFGNRAMFFLCLFITSVPTIMARAVEVRMYTWAYLWVVLGSIQMYYLMQEKNSTKNWMMFIVYSLAASYTHYFAVFTMGVIYIGLFLFFLFKGNRKELLKWCVCFGITVLGYLPWVPNVLRQSESSTTSWIKDTNSIMDVFRSMFHTNIPRMDTYCILLLAAFVLLGVILFLYYKKKELYWSLVCISALFFVALFGMIFQIISRPILTGKYLTIPLCVTILGMSSLCKYINKYIVAMMCMVFVLFSGVVYVDTFQKEYGTKTEETLAFAEENFKEDDIIVSNAGSLSSVIPYYFPNRNTVNDIYEDEYEYLWYFDANGDLDIDRLNSQGIKYIDYGTYGFDVEFNIYYLY